MHVFITGKERRVFTLLLLILFVSHPLAQKNFTIISLPDTQYYTDIRYGGTPAHFTAQTQWIADNKDSLNIVFVAHLGDVVQKGNTKEIPWLYADYSMSIIEDSLITNLEDGIPYGIAVGNHDQGVGVGSVGEPGETELYNQYFGENRFLGRSYYGGHYGTKNDQHYVLFSASGYDFIAIFFEYNTDPDESVLIWADSLLNTYSTRRAIIVSHYIIDAGIQGNRGTQGQAIYERLNDNPNMFLMLCGHKSAEGIRQDSTINGNIVYTLLSDYQYYPNGGNGFLRIMEFSPINNTIQVKTYSPTLNQYETKGSSQFTLIYDMPIWLSPDTLKLLENDILIIDLDTLIIDDNNAGLFISVSQSSEQNINIVIDSLSHIAIFTPFLNYNGTEGFIFTATDLNGVSLNDTIMVTVLPLIEIPVKYAFHQNYPNPFNPVTTLRYDIPENSHVNITIYDMLGRQVKTLINQTQDTGYRSVIWDATNDYGKPVSAGIYLYQIQVGEYMQTKKMVL
ncbi:MAG TPA: T9SS type A sorting domain-containing protein, partial [Candidatus Marinimicrobia bacterium]|nr:T9SS type A sorting domain-containing protein [Candidatus Neomarinimicrobiota bacterium]